MATARSWSTRLISHTLLHKVFFKDKKTSAFPGLALATIFCIASWVQISPRPKMKSGRGWTT